MTRLNQSIQRFLQAEEAGRGRAGDAALARAFAELPRLSPSNDFTQRVMSQWRSEERKAFSRLFAGLALVLLAPLAFALSVVHFNASVIENFTGFTLEFFSFSDMVTTSASAINVLTDLAYWARLTLQTPEAMAFVGLSLGVALVSAGTLRYLIPSGGQQHAMG